MRFFFVKNGTNWGGGFGHKRGGGEVFGEIGASGVFWVFFCKNRGFFMVRTTHRSSSGVAVLQAAGHPLLEPASLHGTPCHSTLCSQQVYLAPVAAVVFQTNDAVG